MDFRVLGTTIVTGANGIISVTAPQLRTVLALLIASPGQVVSTAKIIEALWPADSRQPSDGRNRVQHLIKNLREILGVDDLIVTREPGYLLDIEPSATDHGRLHDAVALAHSEGDLTRRAEILRDALAQWRGDPYADVKSRELDVDRQRCTDLRLKAFDLYIEAELKLGRHREVIGDIREWVTRHPLLERLHYHLILAIYRCDGPVEAQHAFWRCRTLLIEELGEEPGEKLQTLSAQIRDRDPDLLVEEATSGPLSPSGPCEQLPLVPRGFSGRTDELAALSAAAHDGTGALWAITGLGGIGKTSVATHWAHQNQHLFPDGKFYVDLQGHTPGSAPLTTGAALRGFLDALGVDPRRIPDTLHAQAALWRSLVSGKQILVLLDNAADTSQVDALLPGSSSCTVLVTSRDPLTRLITAHGARPLRIGALTETEARAVLTTRAGHTRLAAEPTAANALLDGCAGYPLALSIVAGRLQTDPTATLTELSTDLRDELLTTSDTRDPHVSLPAMLSWSYNALHATESRAFRLLGDAPGHDIGGTAAASLLGVPRSHARALLRGLVDHSLLERTAAGRFRMHDLVRAFAAERAAKDEPAHDREAALRRVIAHYLHSAHAADRLLHPPRSPIPLVPPPHGCAPDTPSGRADAVTWFDAEHRCLLAAQRRAADIGWDDAGWQLAWAMHTFHHRRGHRRDHLSSWQIGKHCATETTLAVRSLVLRLYGGACARADAHQNAQRGFHEALTLAEQAGDVAGQAQTHHFLGWYWLQRGDNPRALDHATSALALLESLDAPACLADVLNLTGTCAAHTGDLDTGHRRCTEALLLAHRHGDRDGEAAALDSLGFIAAAAGNHPQAADHYQQAAHLLAALGNTYAQASTLERLGQARRACGRDARGAWRLALRLYRTQLRDDDADRLENLLCAVQHSENAS